MNLRRLSALGCAIAAALVSLSAAEAQDAMQATSDAQHQSLAELGIEQLLNLEVESIYTASKYEQRVTQAPSSVSIVTADEIKASGHRTLDEVLRSVRGLFVTNDRNYAYVGFRGFQRPGDYTSRVLVLVDGHRINDNVSDAGMVDRSWMIDVELIDRVEVIRGPGSSLYGSSAFFGVVNVVTKRGRHIDGLEVEAGAASFGTYASRLTYGAAHASGLDWLMSASHYDSDGPSRIYYPEYDQRISSVPGASNDGVVENLDGEHASKIFTSLRYGGSSASFYYNERTKAVPTAPFGAIFNDAGMRTLDERAYADVKYERGLTSALQFSARGYYDRFVYQSLLPYNLAPPDAVIDRELLTWNIVGEWTGLETQFTAALGDRHTLVFGGELRENLRENQSAYSAGEPATEILNDAHSSRMYALFVQSETKLREDLSLTAGLRIDDYSAIARRSVTPRAGLIYNPTERSAIKLLYGEAFRAPNPYERISDHHGEHSHQLEPEIIDTYEIVYEHYLDRTYRLSLSAYEYAVDGLIMAHEMGSGDLPSFINGDDIRARGLEAELEGKFASGLHLRGSYAVQKATGGVGNHEISSSPSHLAKLNLIIPLWNRRLTSGIELQYQSESLTLARTRTRDFLLTNLQLTALPFGPDVELAFGVDNLFDAHVEYPASAEHAQTTIEQNGRTFEGRVQVRF